MPLNCCYDHKNKINYFVGTNEAFTFPHDAFPMVTMEKSPQLIVPFQKLNCSFEHVTSSTFLEDNCVQLLELLQEAVRIRIDTWKGSENIGILFSGGLDSVILAALVDRYVCNKSALF